MDIRVERTTYAEVQPMRELYRQEANCQIIRDSCLGRGIADPYLIVVDGETAGYAGVWNKYFEGRLMEIYMHLHQRAHAVPIFRTLLDVVQPTQIEAQTNMPFALTMLFDTAKNIVVENILFADAFTSDLSCPDTLFRRSKAEDNLDCEWVLESNGAVVASGGILYHYNPPYGDIYMEVDAAARGQGFGSYIVQELKRVCHEAGKIPAARCNPDNLISRNTLSKAGLLPIGRLLVGDLSR
jgi:GNAT superfamily N-acetyltransferase